MISFEQMFPSFLLGVLLIYPLWRIFSRAGLNPAMSLFVFVPMAGFLIVPALLAFMDWPAGQGMNGGMEDGRWPVPRA